MLPIEEHIPNIISQLQAHSNLVLQAEPGAGKSTAVPLALMQNQIAQGKKIVMLEPRRVAARSIANYLASLLEEKVGDRVGYQIRNERKTSARTQLEIVTEGVLTRRLQADPELSDIGLIIFDEFHERSIHADLALMLALESQEAYREDLKILVMSATIDADAISSYLNQAPIIRCPGRTFPVSVEYLGKAKGPLFQPVIRAVNNVLRNTQIDGDILVFLPGQGDIKRCIEAATEQAQEGIEYLPLYGSLPLSEQSKVLKRSGSANRRVIFATNIAETSLTIEGIATVIDSGQEKVLSYDVKSGLSRLETNYISKASATQRAGRAGRLQAGHCLRLWSETEHNALKSFQAEEITASDLSDFVLELSAWGITQFNDANWLTPPPLHHFDVAVQLNQKLGLVDASNKITPLGQQALALGVSPRLAAMLLNSHTQQEAMLSCLLAALISERDIFFNAHSADIVDRVLVLHDYLHDKNSIKQQRNIHRGSLEQAKNIALNLVKKLKNLPYSPFDESQHTCPNERPRTSSNHTSASTSLPLLTLTDIQTLTGPLLFNAFPDRLAKARNDTHYLLANGRGVTLKSDDALHGTPWLLVCDCDGKNKDGLIYSCAPLDTSQVETLLVGKTQHRVHYQLDAKKEHIRGRRTTQYQAITLKEETLTHVPKSEFTQCVTDILQEEGLHFLHWTKSCEQWLMRAAWLSKHLNDFPAISEKHLLDTLDTWLLPYIHHVETLKQLKNVNIYDLLVSNLTWEQQQILAQEAPEHYVTPSDKKVSIRYDEHQGPTVAVILQEMFGQITSPCIAQHRVPLRFELLSPARRPLQTTSDLEGFWQSSYLEVAKEMRGRYPKHRWPDNALEAKPGKSIKLKKN